MHHAGMILSEQHSPILGALTDVPTVNIGHILSVLVCSEGEDLLKLETFQTSKSSKLGIFKGVETSTI